MPCQQSQPTTSPLRWAFLIGAQNDFSHQHQWHPLPVPSDGLDRPEAVLPAVGQERSARAVAQTPTDAANRTTATARVPGHKCRRVLRRIMTGMFLDHEEVKGLTNSTGRDA